MQSTVKTMFACLTLAVVASANAADIKWNTSMDKALALAKKTHRPVFVDFYADW